MAEKVIFMRSNGFTSKYLKKSKNYIGVRCYDVIIQGKKLGIKYRAEKTHKYVNWRSKYFESEIDAAKAYDLRSIELGLDPVNILKKK